MIKHEENRVVVEELLGLALDTPTARLMPKLRKYARERLDSGYPNDQLYADFMAASDQISERDVEEEREDAILDTMDFLTGWCAPEARLY
jgi:hypothetical protein